MIRWITPNLGTAPATKAVLEPDMRLLDVRDLVDKPGNEPEEVLKRINQGVSILKDGHRLVVGCDYGISRSNSIAAGILSKYEQIPFNAAAYNVVKATGEQEIKLGPLHAVRSALREPKIPASQNPKVLVTGGNGFIGSRFLSTHAVEGDLFSAPREEIDLCKGSTLLDLFIKKNRISHIVHLANPRIYTSNKAMGEALTLLRNVLDVATENGLHLVFPSSSEIYLGHMKKDILASEDTPPLPKGPFGETKWLCEELIRHAHKVSGLKYTILRAALIYGPDVDRPKFLWNFINRAKKGEPIFTHAYQNNIPAVDILHVDDFCRAIELVITRELEGEYNLGSGHPRQTRDMAQLICQMLGSESKIGQVAVEDKHVNIALDSKLAKTSLGWEPAISFENGLQEMLEGKI